LTGTYAFKLADGRSWYTFLSGITLGKD